MRPDSVLKSSLTVLYVSYCPRKDQHLLSSVNCWYLLLNQTRRESRDHATLSDIYTNNVIVRLAQISEDVIRLFKKVRPSISFLFFLLCYQWKDFNMQPNLCSAFKLSFCWLSALSAHGVRKMSRFCTAYGAVKAAWGTSRDSLV